MTEATRNLLELHFDTAFAAPDGIAKLRELILTLAMQGNRMRSPGIKSGVHVLG